MHSKTIITKIRLFFALAEWLLSCSTYNDRKKRKLLVSTQSIEF